MSVPPYEIGRESRLGNRRINQDRSHAVQTAEFALLALGDGMGGHPRGEMASQILMDVAERNFHREAKPIGAPRDFLKRVFHHAHREIQSFGYAQTPSIDPRTTGVAALIQGDMVYWAHVGDSRFYLFRKGRLLTRTRDHSYVEQLREDGRISADEGDNHPQRHYVTRCLGGVSNPPMVTFGESARLRDGDVILLCTDGFWAHIEETDMAEALEGGEPLDDTIKDLARSAEVAAHPESDNVTVLALRWRDPSRWLRMERGQGEGEGAQTTSGDSDHLNHAIDELNEIVDIFEHRVK